MYFALINKEKSTPTEPVFGAIEVVDGDGYFLDEYKMLPVSPRISRVIDLFDESETIAGLSERYQVDLSDYELMAFVMSE